MSFLHYKSTSQSFINDCQRCGFDASLAFCENFDFHPIGNLEPGDINDYQVFQSTGGSQAEIVTLNNDDAVYPINRAMKMTGSIVDFQILRPLGTKPKRVEMLIKVESGRAGEVQLFLNSSLIPVNVKFNQNGTISGSGYTAYYTQGSWQRLVFILQPEENEVEIFLQDTYQGKANILRDDNTIIDRIRFTNAGLGGGIEYYVDHIAYAETDLSHTDCLSGQIVRVKGPGVNECLQFESMECANSFGYSDCETIAGECEGVFCPTELTPKDGATNVSLNPIIQWYGGGQVMENKISLGTSPNNFELYQNISVGASTQFSAYNLPAGKKIYVKLEVIGNGGSKTCTSFFTTRPDNCNLPCDFGYSTRDCESFEFYTSGPGKMFPEARYKFDYDGSNSVNNINVTSTLEGNYLALQNKYSVSYKIEKSLPEGKHFRIECQFRLPVGSEGNIGLIRKSGAPFLFISLNNGMAQFLGLSGEVLPYDQGVWNRLIIFGDVTKKTLNFYINNKLLYALNNQDLSVIKNLVFYSTSNSNADKMDIDNIGYREREYINVFFHLDRDAPNDNFNEEFAVNYGNSIDTLRIFADRDSSFIKILDSSIRNRIGNNDILELKIISDNIYNGKFKLEEKTEETRIYKLNHPDYVYGDKFNDEFTLSLFDSRSQCICDTQKLEVYPAPLLLIHGINSDPSTFDKLREKFIYNHIYRGAKYTTEDPRTIFIWDLNYSNATDQHISKNAKLVPKTIERMRNFYKGYKQIPLGKIDIISHSMGGLITRFYVQEGSFNHDINRFITINTPHYGTQLANIPYNCQMPKLMNYLRLQICSESKIYLGCEENNASLDLKVDSDVIKLLNRNFNEGNGTLCHAIVSHKIWPFNTFGVSFINEIYNGEQNDFVVPLSSQLGGLSGEHKTNFPNLWHSESLNHPTIINRAYELLNDPQLNTSFSKQWFKPGTLSFNCPKGFEPVATTNSIDITTINQNHIYGQPFQVDYNIPNNFTDYSVVSDLILDQVNKTSCIVNTWDSPLGYHTLYTVGIDTINKMESVDSTEIYQIGRAHV